MSKETDPLESLQSVYSKSTDFYSKNKNLVIGISIAVIAIVGLLLYGKMKWLPEREANAQKAMYISVFHFEQDTFKLALNGDKRMPGAQGFKDVINNFSFTDAANLSKYYAGICELKTGNYAKAIEYLDSYKPKDELLRAQTNSLLGDAYSEKGNTDKALGHYAKSTECTTNSLIAPILCLKAGMAHEKFNKKEEAIKFYNKIKNEYPFSEQAQQIDKYIYRASASTSSK